MKTRIGMEKTGGILMLVAFMIGTITGTLISSDQQVQKQEIGLNDIEEYEEKILLTEYSTEMLGEEEHVVEITTIGEESYKTCTLEKTVDDPDVKGVYDCTKTDVEHPVIRYGW